MVEYPAKQLFSIYQKPGFLLLKSFKVSVWDLKKKNMNGSALFQNTVHCTAAGNDVPEVRDAGNEYQNDG